MDLSIAILKFVTITITGLFGALGLLTDFKNEETNKVSFYGKLALSGIVISTLVALATQSLEYWRDQKKASIAAIEAKEAAIRTEITMNNLSRLLQPIEHVDLSLQFTLDDKHEQFTEYFTLLRKELKKVKKLSLESPSPQIINGIMYVDVDIDGEGNKDIYTIEYKFPMVSRFENVTPPFWGSVFWVDWFVEDNSTKASISGSPEGDMTLIYGAVGTNIHSSMLGVYEKEHDKFIYTVSFKNSTSKLSDNGKISSVLDAPGSVFRIKAFFQMPIKLESATVTLAEGKRYKLTNLSHKIVDGNDIYYGTLPETWQ